MEGLVEYFISGCDEIEREIAEVYDAKWVSLSHFELLALQLAGVSDETIIRSVEDGREKSLKDKLKHSFLVKARWLLKLQRILGVKTTSFLTTSSYPKKLNIIGRERPILIHYMGDWRLFQSNILGIIGSEKASQIGLIMAEDMGIAYGGTEKDRKKWYIKTGCPDFIKFPYSENSPYVIAGRLAFGCDREAHRGCLSVDGETIAIAATVLDMVNPIKNQTLVTEILKKGGLVISELAIGRRPSLHYQAEGRILSALADKVAIAECNKGGRTMYIADYAHKMHKSIITVDYSPCEAFSDGNTRLLEEGIACSIPYPF